MVSAQDNAEIGGDLRELRKAAGFSQEQTAHLAKCSTASVRLLEAGYRPRTSGVLARILNVLNDERRPTGNGTPFESSAMAGPTRGS